MLINGTLVTNGDMETDGSLFLTGLADIDGNIALSASSSITVDGDAGSTGQILSSTGTALSWIDPPTTDDGDWTPLSGNLYRETGNVGIGLTAPARDLHIIGSKQPLLVETDAHRTGIVLRKNSGSMPQKSFGISVEGLAPDLGLLVFSDLGVSDTGLGLVRMVLDNSGRVGIGTPIPTQRLDISDDFGFGSIEIGDTETGSDGTIKYDGTNFRGYNGIYWKRLDAGGPTGRADRVIIVDGDIIPDIQAAIDSLSAEGGKIYIPEGTWTLPARVIVGLSNVVIEGSGPSTIVGPPPTLSSFYLHSCNNIIMRDMTISQSTTAFGRDCVEISNSSNVKFENIDFLSGHSGVRVSSVSGDEGLFISRCSFKGQNQAIAVMDTGLTDISITGCSFDLEGTGQQAIYIDTGREITITDNRFRDGVYTSCEIWVSDGVTISDNVMSNPGTYGLVFSDTKNAVVIGNSMDGPMSYGISFEDSRRAIVASNSIGDSINVMEYGLYITNSPELNIEANGVQGAEYGVYISSCPDSRVGGNRTKYTTIYDYYINLCTNSSITGNLGKAAGFRVSDSQYSVISGNSGSAMDIEIITSPNSVVTGNNSGAGSFSAPTCIDCALDNNL